MRTRFIAVSWVLTLYCNVAFGKESGQPNLVPLQSIAAEISAAMTQGDFQKILSYDFAELREEHQRDLENKSSDFYCYLVGQGCQSSRKYSSIQSQFAGMKKPDFAIRQLSKTEYLIVFFDRAKYERATVVRMSFLCKHTDVDTPVWTFGWTNHQWKALHPVFNYETDPFCAEPYPALK